AIFIVGCLGCGLAQSMPQLIFFRGVQGFGGGMVFACVFTVVGDLFPPAERGKYIGLFAGTFAVANVTGPALGGLLTDHVGWRWCFFLSVPFILAAIVLTSANLPPQRVGGRLSSIDFKGA